MPPIPAEPRRCRHPSLLLGAALLLGTADGPDLSHGGPVTITAQSGVDWQQDQQIVVARGNAHATRGETTVIADSLTAHYRKKAAVPGAAKPAAAGSDDVTGSNEVYRFDAVGHVTINTPTDIAYGDHAVYDIDQAVLVMTGAQLRLLTPTETITARDRLEYWSMQRKSVAWGRARVVGNDGRSVAADVLVAYSDPPARSATATTKTAAPKPGSDDAAASAGPLRRVDAFGHVTVRTQADIVTGEDGVYMPQDHIARVIRNVTITHGLSTLHGQDAVINLATGIAHLLPGTGPVQGLLVPNDHSADTPEPKP